MATESKSYYNMDLDRDPGLYAAMKKEASERSNTSRKQMAKSNLSGGVADEDTENIDLNLLEDRYDKIQKMTEQIKDVSESFGKFKARWDHGHGKDHDKTFASNPERLVRLKEVITEAHHYTKDANDRLKAVVSDSADTTERGDWNCNPMSSPHSNVDAEVHNDALGSSAGVPGIEMGLRDDTDQSLRTANASGARSPMAAGSDDNDSNFPEAVVTHVPFSARDRDANNPINSITDGEISSLSPSPNTPGFMRAAAEAKV